MHGKASSVSVIVSTYNKPGYLRLCLQSLGRQSVPADEILIADDGSGSETKAVIEAFAAVSPVPVVHEWHPDDGFRKSIILNRTIARAKGDYLVMVDGDMIVHRDLIKDHLGNRRDGCLLCGSQVRLKEKTAKKLLDTGSLRIPWGVRAANLNAWRIPWLMRWMLPRYKQGAKHGDWTLRGGHMSIRRSDMIAVNGYDEDFVGWGYEDTDLGVRLRNSGLKVLYLKFGAVMFHIWHRENSRHNAEENRWKMTESIERCKIRCDKGIDQYL